MRRQSPLAWASLILLGLVAAWFWEIEKRDAAMGTLAALAGCLGLILPPRERMRVLPWRIRALPRRLDALPVWATLLTTPGYGLNWFYGANPYDEAVHLLNGAIAGLVFAALLLADGRPRGRLRLAGFGAASGLALGLGWEVFEWWTALIGSWRDTWTDILLTTLGTMLGSAVAPALLPRAGAPGR